MSSSQGRSTKTTAHLRQEVMSLAGSPSPSRSTFGSGSAGSAATQQPKQSKRNKKEKSQSLSQDGSIPSTEETSTGDGSEHSSTDQESQAAESSPELMNATRSASVRTSSNNGGLYGDSSIP